MKDNIKTNVLNSMDINGSYLLLDKSNDKYGNNYKFSLNNIIVNSDISNNAEDLTDYKKTIFENYINILNNAINKKNYDINNKENIDNNNNLLNINDYAQIILLYISIIQNKIDEIEKIPNKNINNNKIIEKYKKIISSLRLFCILFLNCFMYKPEKEYINDASLFTNSLSDKVQSYRKRLLIEWCIDEQKNKIERNISKESNNVKANYEKLYSFGQIKKNVDDQNRKKISLFMRAKLSNNNEKISKNNMYYFTGFNPTYGEDNRQFNDIFIDKYNNDWISFFVQSLL